jgi:hypothetical protein
MATAATAQPTGIETITPAGKKAVRGAFLGLALSV